MASPLIAVTDKATFCRLMLRRSAVTMTSSRSELAFAVGVAV
jgi:hypothetical protein